MCMIQINSGCQFFLFEMENKKIYRRNNFSIYLCCAFDECAFFAFFMCERVCGNVFQKMTISQVELGLCKSEEEEKSRINKMKMIYNCKYYWRGSEMLRN